LIDAVKEKFYLPPRDKTGSKGLSGSGHDCLTRFHDLEPPAKILRLRAWARVSSHKIDRRDVLSISILLVDDFEPWRRLVCSIVKKERSLEITCEASDGLEAVQKAEELRPDLILLDIGLPRINGIEAARRIRHVSPDSKIVFLTMDNSPDVAQEALSTGAQGFVHKIRAQSELIPAIELVLRRQPVPSKSKSTRSMSPLICLNET
jgi:CheY-like chemotaxis protein